jgi:hypothetical protein
MEDPELAKIRPPVATFLPMIFWAAVAAFLLPAIPIAIREDSVLDGLTAGAFSAAGTIPVLVIICIACTLTYHVRVHPGGLSSYNPYGSWKREFMTWGDMSEIHRVHVLGVPYMRITADAGAQLWIPTRVFQAAALVSAVVHTAPDSRLASWMQHAAFYGADAVKPSDSSR